MSTSAYTPPYKYSAVYRHMSARITPVSSASYTCEGEAGVGGGFAGARRRRVRRILPRRESLRARLQVVVLSRLRD